MYTNIDMYILYVVQRAFLLYTQYRHMYILHICTHIMYINNILHDMLIIVLCMSICTN